MAMMFKRGDWVMCYHPPSEDETPAFRYIAVVKHQVHAQRVEYIAHKYVDCPTANSRPGWHPNCWDDIDNIQEFTPTDENVADFMRWFVTEGRKHDSV
jgi:hypothetical protein